MPPFKRFSGASREGDGNGVPAGICGQITTAREESRSVVLFDDDDGGVGDGAEGSVVQISPLFYTEEYQRCMYAVNLLRAYSTIDITSKLIV